MRADNKRAIGLYERFGLEREGTRQGFVRTAEGDLVDDHIYVRWLG